jgi:hypothetical protein
MISGFGNSGIADVRFDSTFMDIEAWSHPMRVAEKEKVVNSAREARSSPNICEEMKDALL